MLTSWTSWRLGSWLGFPISLSPSFLLLLLFVFVAFGGIGGVIVVALAFAGVLLHELGHAVVARHFGVRVTGIELGFFGGAAQMANLPREPRRELAIAAAGPAVSLMLAGAGLGLASVLHSPLLGLVGWTNLVIAGFNLIPALPMDGGRILRAALATRMGHARATRAAVSVARVATVGFGLLGLAWGSFQLMLLAPFLWMQTSREAAIAQPEAAPAHRRYYVRRADGSLVAIDV